jgi:hypothetical protein
MDLLSFIKEADEEISYLKLKKDLTSEELPKQIQSELESWITRKTKEFKVPETKMFRSPYKKYFMEMIKASDFTCEYYKIPKFTLAYIKGNVPQHILKMIYDKYGNEEEIMLMVFFFFLNDIMEVKCLLGGNFWNFEIFRENQIFNDDMRAIEYRKEEYKDEDK